MVINGINWTDEDIKLVERFIEIKNKGYYCDGTQLTEVYNRVLEKNVKVTNCGSCLRQRVCELEDALNHFRNASSLHSNPLGVSKKLSERQKEIEVEDTKEEENKEPKKAGKKK